MPCHPGGIDFGHSSPSDMKAKLSARQLHSLQEKVCHFGPSQLGGTSYGVCESRESLQSNGPYVHASVFPKSSVFVQAYILYIELDTIHSHRHGSILAANIISIVTGILPGTGLPVMLLRHQLKFPADRCQSVQFALCSQVSIWYISACNWQSSHFLQLFCCLTV